MTHAPRLVSTAFALLVAMLALTAVSDAQSVTARLDMFEEELFDLQRTVDQERRAGSRDITAVQDELDSLVDEVTYFRVKYRKEGMVDDEELRALRAHIDDLSNRLDEGVWDGAATDVEVTPSEARVPVGTEIDVRLQTSLHSDRSMVEDPVRATTVADLQIDGAVVPAGSEIRGVVTAVDRSSRTDRTSSLTVMFDEVEIDNTTYPATLSVVEAIESGGLKDEAGRAGVGAGVGGVIGGLLGGVRGALAGILIGAGGTVMATEGKDVDLPAGTVLRLRFDTPLAVR